MSPDRSTAWRLVLVLVASASLAVCGARATRPDIASKGPRQGHVEIRDSSVDALPDYRVPVTPDLVFAIIDIDADAVVFRLRHRPDSFDPAITRLVIDLDTDQNAATGSEGIEHSVVVFPAGGRGADVLRMTSAGGNIAGTVPVSFVVDGCDVAVPLSLLGNDDGRFDFRVRVYAQPAWPLVVDVLPDVGLVRID